MNDMELLRALRALDRERSPRRDLWPAIAAGIEAGHPRSHRRPPRRHWVPLAMAASALLAAVVMWPAALEDGEPGSASAPVAVILEGDPEADADLGRAHGDRMLRQADALSIEFRVALAQLEAGPLPPALRPAARDLRESELALREALREQPHSRYLLGQLRRTYEQQLRLSQMAALG
jgi:hypothetical protein